MWYYINLSKHDADHNWQFKLLLHKLTPARAKRYFKLFIKLINKKTDLHLYSYGVELKGVENNKIYSCKEYATGLNNITVYYNGKITKVWRKKQHETL